MKEETLRKIAQRAFEEALRDFYYPPIPKPEIIFSPRDKETIRIDEENWRIQLNIARHPDLPQELLERFYRILWRKGISYYVVCPYDLETSSKILSAAISVSDEYLGRIAANLLVEFIVTGYLSKVFREDLMWFYQVILSKFKFRTNKEEVLSIISILVIENLIGELLVPLSFREKLSRDIIDSALRIYKILIKDGLLARETWFSKAQKIATILASLLSKKRHKRIKRANDALREFFMRDILDTSLFVSMLKIGEISNLEELKEKIIGSVMTFTSDIIRVTPAIMALKIFNKPREIVRYWYRNRARGKIKIHLMHIKEKKTFYMETPATWNINDPTEELDVVLSLSSFPKMIPGITTKKWDKTEIEIEERISHPPDLLIIIDSSGSMGYLPGWIKPAIDRKSEEYKILKKLGIRYPLGSKFDIALTSAFAAVEYALMRNSQVAVVNFSGKGIICDWTLDRRKIEDCLMIYQGNGTELPVRKIKSILEKTESKVLVILITDAEIFNEKETIQCLREILEHGHHLYVFHIEEKGYYPVLNQVQESGGVVIRIKKLEELTDVVIGELKKYYLIM